MLILDGMCLNPAHVFMITHKPHEGSGLFQCFELLVWCVIVQVARYKCQQFNLTLVVPLKAMQSACVVL